ncbi:ribonuclease H-like domain-containing protein [Biscogniauxia mediterranea]|nr:ribonuclease H-like domain-containing protein [Biscogniauxia mediterranea]
MSQPKKTGKKQKTESSRRAPKSNEPPPRDSNNNNNNNNNINNNTTVTAAAHTAVPGRKCECRICTLKAIHCEPRDEPWLRKKQSPRQLPLDLRLLNARFAMLRDGFYLPTVFDPAPFLPASFSSSSPSSSSLLSSPSLPQQLFPESLGRWTKFPGFSAHRFALHRPRAVGPRLPIKVQLVYTSGACAGEGTPAAVGGVGVAFCAKGREGTRGCVGSPLEAAGPEGERAPPTQRRAALRALVKALEWRYWYREGWEALVLATDSAYVAEGATARLRGWLERRWFDEEGEEDGDGDEEERRRKGGLRPLLQGKNTKKVENRDLWRRLLHLFRLYGIHGCEVMIWQITREQNALAAGLARDGVARGVAKCPARWSSRRDPLLKHDRHFNF